MRTKSLRIPSCVSSSTSSVPVRPPARPVQTTGAPRRLRARATLIPFPPALGKPTLARCRWPGWKLGTTSVRSIAALSVTVTIIRLGAERAPGAILAEFLRARDDRRRGCRRPRRAPGRRTSRPAPGARARGCRAPPPGRRAPPRVAVGDDDLAELLALGHGEVDHLGRDDALDELRAVAEPDELGRPGGRDQLERLVLREGDGAVAYRSPLRTSVNRAHWSKPHSRSFVRSAFRRSRDGLPRTTA